MNKDDLVYLTLLVLSIPLGFLFRASCFDARPRFKALTSASTGLTIVWIVCQYDIVYSLVLVLSNTFIINLFHPKVMPYISFVWCFSYLLFFRMTDYFGLPKPLPYANAVQLILTLKSVGLAFEIHDTYMRRLKLGSINKKKDETDLAGKKEAEILRLELEYISIKTPPSLLDTLCYSYCYIGILTGPYFKYRTYQDWLNSKYRLGLSESFKSILRRSKYILLILAGFLLISKFVSFSDPLKQSFYENPLWYRLAYMSLIFTLFRFRFYIAWIFSEYACIISSFGAYPVISKPKPGAGPTCLIDLANAKTNKLELNFNTVHNIDEYACETETTVKRVLHYWNMSVQWWMANNVYKRIPFKSGGQPLTMALSAYWHGIHPGYYLSMLTTSPCIIAENFMEKGLKLRLKPRYHFIYNFIAWIFRTREFDYMSIGFILLSYQETIKYWRSVYFIGHLSCLFFILLGFILNKLPKKQAKKTENRE